ncbi:peptidylprolyl isomerase [Tuwongella immobilis]|uniref:peptidylprolyl isomerase n=1 Tax=Tuwongella immobilis TaxID=692036 RepID=A0A6C2YHF6_9BACT|nr:peptidylprolyl isomerase [Tuwongella immobilis]VIP00847.1 peptidyl-prolyl cis-trans isomerase : Peptidyl-prolyl cis-trans isomerase OS=Clostridium sp. CAG:230 GN=BN547_00336 PE=3 SV=1: Pro_isomerase [Tuwongella immobilis]VTR97112.1 peptidyl-prolyl cis-trans isomerase : Peptidyl-prolyl cis-trans isomerase OS=Clostridium sp. CAG:230 GN=BN547_00336 PE=3 SV=1: Pro_isomerase [Tuwongella immobilis]
MALATWRRRWTARMLLAGLIGCTSVGCGGAPTPPPAEGGTTPASTSGGSAATPANPSTTPAVANATPAGTPAASPTEGTENVSITRREIDPRFMQPFAEACIVDEIPDGMQLPVDRTLAGKSTGTLRDAVEKEWANIPLVSVAGTPLQYVATVQTSAGSFEIALKPEWAPNHVRNFLALVKVGYYDGLLVDRLIRQEFVDTAGMKSRLDLFKLGCPKGTGEDGIGHIGYFLQPEFTKNATHEAGTVGYWHEDLPQTAGTRLYITVSTAPALDQAFSVFGKVTAGMEVVQRISASPTKSQTDFPDLETPATPITIQKITIRRDDMENPAPFEQNKR